jgi:hypothetical protein
LPEQDQSHAPYEIRLPIIRQRQPIFASLFLVRSKIWPKIDRPCIRAKLRQQAERAITGEQRSRMRQELETMVSARREETRAFAKHTLEGVESGNLGPDEIDLLAEFLSRSGRPVSGKVQVLNTLRCLVVDPDFLQPIYDTPERAWVHESMARYVVSGSASASKTEAA